jgi:hypothetical protein
MACWKDNPDGTVTDTTIGRVWLKDAIDLQETNWKFTAGLFCDTCRQGALLFGPPAGRVAFQSRPERL